MSDVEEHVGSGDAGASHTQPIQANNVKKGGHVMLKGHPCRVVDISTSKTGKHGHAKANIVGIDIFSGKKYEDICPTSHNMDQPIVKRAEYQLIDVDSDGYVSLMDENGDIKSDLQLPKEAEGGGDEVSKMITSMFADSKSIGVSVLSACGQEKIVAAKEINQ